jgi:uncharacterized protein (DUF736 family)
MPKYDNDLRGALFKNDKKEKENHPDYKGNCEISGVEFWVSAWIKEAESGRKYLSLSFQEKQSQTPGNKPKKRQEDLGDVPF